MNDNNLPVPDWASHVLRRTWSNLSPDDQRALIDDHEQAALRDLDIQLRRTTSPDSLGARPSGDFTLDGFVHNRMRWHAERFEEPWNGWATPVVTRATLENLVEDLTRLGSAPGHIADEGICTVFRDADDDGNFDITPDADGLYHLFELGWCFIALP
ncbi:hypothetical protein L5I01_11635 [Gordonia sp. HY442]|uniref:hypothetical protein n=1 Tax=Gordonia zhenghanii TaxID=2911516 RepID=UPI001F3A6F67|nr:hypothetical protein [Gordonia zhenghanii]MCF8604008.1 hypothetical protein [Gordonia zhenghanii]